WMLAAVLNGWAASNILEAYQAERQPITDQVSRFAFNVAKNVSQQRRQVSADIEYQDKIGEAARATLGREAYNLYVQQRFLGGLNFGYFYADSPIIAYDGASHPVYSMGRFESSSVPGCRGPHVWLNGGTSLYDACGEGFALLRLDPRARISGLVDAVAQRGVPLKIVEVDARDVQSLYAHKLVLLRPDRHVAWRGDEEPVNPVALIDLVRGAATQPARKVT